MQEELFHCLRKLNDQGVPMEDLKELIPDLIHTKEEIKKKKSGAKIIELWEHDGGKENFSGEEDFNGEKNYEDEGRYTILRKILRENNRELAEAVNESVTRNIVKEMDFLLQAKERAEEERFKKLDVLIRQQQTIRKESGMSTLGGRLKKLFES